ncbi:MAG: NADH-quinone oxidoreductase subunit NuoE [Nitrospirales bacterium]
MIFDKYKDEVDELLSRYLVKRSALLPLLYIAQREEGYVSESAMKEIAKILGLTPSQVFETVTFYSMYNLKPIGKFHVQVCRSLMCALVGSDSIVEWIQKKLDVSSGQTTKDGNFTLSVVECLGSCGTGPMMQINDDYYERLTEEKVGQILDELKQNGSCSMKSGPFMFPEKVKS